MKKNILPFVFTVLFLSTINLVQAQQHTSDDLRIRELEKTWTAFLDKNDTAALKNIWTEEYVVNNANGRISTRKQILNILKGGHVFSKVDRNIERITFNGDIAVVMGAETEFQNAAGGKSAKQLKRRFTNIWIKKDSDWKLVARQATPVSF